ncbi:MAG: YkgJ family cysteine cluster protein [Kiritimatiellae bacterium]|jgi:Fe-S-cluster containining protein|nr:YkgJ family cysteine cluster protein [Kiritimatiellia bacterium]
MSNQLENFSCRRCGFCCSIPGYVNLEEGEAERIAAFLSMELYAFTDQYTTLTLGRRQLTLIEKEDGRCIFLEDDNSCRIQGAKPVQCIGFPYKWRSKELEKGCAGFKALCSASKLLVVKSEM